jgi:type I restriction enzyme S subunit
MFPQHGETKPRLRFKGFEGEWKSKDLVDCVTISKECNSGNRYGVNDVLSVSDDFGVVNQIELLGRSYAGKSVTNYKILHKDEIVYTKSPLKSKPFGIVKKNNYKTGIVSVLYAVYKVNEGISAGYIHYYFDPSWRLNSYLRPLVNKGAKNTMNISDEMALTGSIMLPPTLDEQRQIADFFTALDRRITLETQRLEKLKQIKSACLDKMFV